MSIVIQVFSRRIRITSFSFKIRDEDKPREGACVSGTDCPSSPLNGAADSSETDAAIRRKMDFILSLPIKRGEAYVWLTVTQPSEELSSTAYFLNQIYSL